MNSLVAMRGWELLGLLLVVGLVSGTVGFVGALLCVAGAGALKRLEDEA